MVHLHSLLGIRVMRMLLRKIKMRVWVRQRMSEMMLMRICVSVKTRMRIRMRVEIKMGARMRTMINRV